MTDDVTPPPPAPPVAPPAPIPAAVPFASWFSRVAAAILDGLLDFAVALVPTVIGIVWFFSSAETRDLPGGGTEITSFSGGSVVVLVLAGVISIVFDVWNRGWRQGVKGQSIAKGWLGITVVGKDDGRPQGGGMGIVRYILATVLGQLCFLNYLWPLWDAEHRTWHDMVVGSYVVKNT